MANEITIRVYEQGQGTVLNGGGSGTIMDRGASFGSPGIGITGLTAGDHTLEVTAEDTAAGKAESSRVSTGTFTVDATEVTVDADFPVKSTGDDTVTSRDTPSFSTSGASLLLALIGTQWRSPWNQTGIASSVVLDPTGSATAFTKLAGSSADFLTVDVEIWALVTTEAVSSKIVRATWPGASIAASIVLYSLSGYNASDYVGWSIGHTDSGTSNISCTATMTTAGSLMFVVGAGTAGYEATSAGAGTTLTSAGTNAYVIDALRTTTATSAPGDRTISSTGRTTGDAFYCGVEIIP